MESNEELHSLDSKLDDISDDLQANKYCVNHLIDSVLNADNETDSRKTINKSYSLSSASSSKKCAVPELNLELLNALEIEVRGIAASVDDLTENLSSILRSISALTLDCLETYRTCICKTCDAIDYNIKLMYQLMAKCEELSKVAEPLNALSQNIKDIKNVLDMFDNTMNPW